MKKKVSALKVGDRVGIADSRGGKLVYDPKYGAVTDVLSTGKVMVKWDSEWLNSYGDYKDPWDPSRLMLEADLKKVYSKLEAEFSVLEKEIVAKLKEAGKLIKEADKIAKKSGRALHDMYEAVHPLESAMDAAGWNTSSWNC